MKSNYEEKLAALTKAVSYAFAIDGTSPGVLTSMLKNHHYYMSVVRYGAMFANGKQVVCKSKSDSLDMALDGLIREFLLAVPSKRNPIDELQGIADEV